MVEALCRRVTDVRAVKARAARAQGAVPLESRGDLQPAQHKRRRSPRANIRVALRVL